MVGFCVLTHRECAKLVIRPPIYLPTALEAKQLVHRFQPLGKLGVGLLRYKCKLQVCREKPALEQSCCFSFHRDFHRDEENERRTFSPPEILIYKPTIFDRWFSRPARRKSSPPSPGPG
jgi:hypothetical protein